MPIDVLYSTVKANETATFNFGEHTVLDFTVGIAYWKFGYGNDNFITNIDLSLVVNKASPSTITAKVVGRLHDDSGNTLDIPNSSVVVCCIAVLDTKNSNVELDSAYDISNNGQSRAIRLPSASPAILATFVSGWRIGYNNDHQVAALAFGTGVTLNGNEATIKATASIHDNSGNQATTAQVDGGLVSATTTSDGILQQALVSSQTSNTVKVDFGKPLSKAVVLLQNYEVTFHKNQDNHVRTVGGGCAKWSVDGSSVNLESPKAFITDDSGNVATDSASNVTLVVLGLPKA
ncbi:hypothetical protein [Myxococcus landrumensis]|uniref:Big-1 domain-containing protein n=1 Tax=Myxococcus landrumensis TaxID=2813577 RepID=A0ABX7NJI6_9BACT|nr:hypothetical protein [Myxococcus landrumus]QSQ17644.1 hypothetical protein JY572_17055 [Myxococcus landrumus]